MCSISPLREWVKKKRRNHKVLPEFDKINRTLGLPENFLVGMWRDWRLNWVWKLEKVLQKWEKLVRKSRD